MKPTSHPRSKDALPIKQAVAALTSVRRTFQVTIRQYARLLEGEIAHVAKRVASESEPADRLRERAHDLRDMLLMIRALSVKPDKGRRRDLKRIESLIEDLRSIVDRW